MTTAYDPHAILQAWLDTGWESNEHECEVASIAWGHRCGDTAHFGTWAQNIPNLEGFASFWDAYAFIVAATGIDPLDSCPDANKRWTKQPQPDTLEPVEPTPAPYAQFRLFAEVTP